MSDKMCEDVISADVEKTMTPIPARPMYFSFCNCTERIERPDCIYYDEEQDMGAHIPFCKRYMRTGYCPCLGCEKFEKKKNGWLKQEVEDD